MFYHEGNLLALTLVKGKLIYSYPGDTKPYRGLARLRVQFNYKTGYARLDFFGKVFVRR